MSLTAELVRRSSRDRAVIVTWASSAYLDFLQNWVHHLTSMDVDNILIGAPSLLPRRCVRYQMALHCSLFGW